ncbi:MAG: hypothetical protein N2201_01520 [candidate division WOR-3 bacterium]|nr:hypothetical protein [candidate division WOR-3 bacterium]
MILIDRIINKYFVLGIIVLFGFYYVLANDMSSRTKELDIETGIVFSGYNDVQIPRSTGTRFSLSQQLKINPEVFIRARFNFVVNPKHTVSALIAPLRLKATGSVDFPLRFQDTVFPAGITLNAVYRFNSYRLTYRYNFVNKSNFILGVGLTAKIRDAEISLASHNIKSKKTNIGFVPLINFQMQYWLKEKFNLLLDGDALAVAQGRAEDIFIGGTYKVSDNLRIKLGYRVIEGGADVEEVYNFAWLNYGILGIMLKI